MYKLHFLSQKKSIGKIPKALVYNKSYLPQHLSNDEKSKHQSYILKMGEQPHLDTITNKLTPDDIRILIETEDEYTRRGNFVRVFPTTDSKKYLRLFETPRYYNLLLHEWIRKYGNNSERGIKLLNHYCIKNVHRQNPAQFSENQVNKYILINSRILDLS